MDLLGSKILEFALSVAFLFLLVSCICSATAEWISKILNLRSKMLQTGIEELFTQPAKIRDQIAGSNAQIKQDLELASARARDLSRQVLQHPVIQTPAVVKELIYIPSPRFTLALLDYITKDADEPGSYDAIQDFLKGDVPYLVRRALTPLVTVHGDELSASQKLDRAREAVSKWFDDSMLYVSAQYKQRMHLILFGLGLLVAAVLNVDAIHLCERLWVDGTLRSALAASADKVAATGSDIQAKEVYELASKLPLPIGWSGAGRPLLGLSSLGLMVVGWFLTACAAAMGAPFWFDLLHRAASMRSNKESTA